MMEVTKIFSFEMAHAIFGYQGACRNIHGHSYVLHISVSSKDSTDRFLSPPGFIIDFKQLKHLVKSHVVDRFDHSLVVSQSYLKNNPGLLIQDNCEIWEFEPTAENILLFIIQILSPVMPKNISITSAKLYETKDSYVTWRPDNLP